MAGEERAALLREIAETKASAAQVRTILDTIPDTFRALRASGKPGEIEHRLAPVQLGQLLRSRSDVGEAKSPETPMVLRRGFSKR